MAVTFEIDVPSAARLQARLRADGAALAAATAQGVRATTRSVQQAIRRQLIRARLATATNKGLAGALRSEVEPKSGPSLNATGRIFSKATVKRASGTYDLFDVFTSGATISARGGRWLAVPLRNAPRRGRRRLSPGDFPRDALVLHFGPGGGVVCFKFAPDTPVWVLIRQVRLRPRINPDAAFVAGTKQLETRIAKTWDRLVAKAGLPGVAA